MTAPAVAPPLRIPGRARSWLATAFSHARPVWSKAAAQRAVRAAVVVPGLFAVADRVIGNPQIATYAAFGGFATLVLASFGGNRRDKLVAHLGLAVAGSILLVIGTAVNSVTALAATVTVPVVFVVLFAGVASSNVASGATAALLAYVLSAASPGTVGMIPDRLAGWWMASIAGTAAVLIVYTRPPVDRLRQEAAATAGALAAQIEAAMRGEPSAALADAALAAKHRLLGAFTDVPYRPTGLTAPDQAIAGLVEALQWSTVAVAQATRENALCAQTEPRDRLRLEQAAKVLALTADLLAGGPASGLEQALAGLDALLEPDPVFPYPDRPEDRESLPARIHQGFHSRAVATAVRSVAADALIAARRTPDGSGPPAPHHVVRDMGRLVAGHTSLRSVWFLNSARGAVALAAAVAVADLSNLQHGFWVVLGALSVLRTSASATGATALRALGGTVAGVVVGAGLIIIIGSNTPALWAALPLAVLVAAYAPGTAPFAVGQAAFTVTISVLYNLIVPVGWRIGEVRVEDVAIGAGISVAVGILFWPRGTVRVVAQDMADAFHAGGVYLVQATTWALGVRDSRPEEGMAVASAANRLDEGLRGLLAEQGTKKVSRQTLWTLVGGTLRLRLMAQALAASPEPALPPAESEARPVITEAVRLAGLYDALATRLGRAPVTVAQELAHLHLGDGDLTQLRDPHAIWVGQHVEHLQASLGDLDQPAEVVAARLADPWWRTARTPAPQPSEADGIGVNT